MSTFKSKTKRDGLFYIKGDLSDIYHRHYLDSDFRCIPNCLEVGFVIKHVLRNKKYLIKIHSI